jgi:hypothetical protein
MALESLYPGLSIGGYLIVDDYGALEECRNAVDEFRSRHAIEERIEQVDWTCVRWRREHPAPNAATQPALGSEPSGRSAQATAERSYRRVPTLHELSLIDELEAVRRRLKEVSAELARLRGSALVAGWERLRGLLDRRRGS